MMTSVAILFPLGVAVFFLGDMDAAGDLNDENAETLEGFAAFVVLRVWVALERRVTCGCCNLSHPPPPKKKKCRWLLCVLGKHIHIYECVRLLQSSLPCAAHRQARAVLSTADIECTNQMQGGLLHNGNIVASAMLAYVRWT